MAKSIAVRASQSVFFFSAWPVFCFTVIYRALSFPEGIASGESASTIGCCWLLSSASISCCQLHRLLWAAPSTCPITTQALGSGSGCCGSRSGPPSEIFPRKFPRRHWLVIKCGVAALWRYSLPLVLLLPLRCVCRSPSNAAVFKISTAAPLLSPFAAELVGLSRALAFARAWFVDIAERQCFAPRDGIRLHAAQHVAHRASLPAPRPRSGALRLLHLRLHALCQT